jgi:hypothetical protein
MTSNTGSLKAAKRALIQQRAELEEDLRGNYAALKELLTAGTQDNTSTEIPSDLRSLVKSGLRYGIRMVARKLTSKAVETVDKIL